MGARDITSLEETLETARQAGIDHVIVSPWVQVLGEAFDSEPQALEVCRLQNRELAALPPGMTALGTIPLRSPALAAAELRRVLELGLAGVEVTAAVAGAYLGDPAFEPFWAAAERLGAVVFVHPGGQLDAPGVPDRYVLWNTVGSPAQTAATAADMVMSGVMERHPELRVLLAHGGGGVAQLQGRLDHAWRVRPEGRARLGEPPSASLRRFFYDSCVYDAAVLRHLVEFAGASQVLLGTDHPFEMGDPDPLGLVRAAQLDAGAEEAVLSGNAARLLAYDS